MNILRRSCCTLALILSAGSAWAFQPADPPAAAASGPGAPAENNLVRVVDAGNGDRLGLDVAIRTFAPATGSGPVVHLVGVVHIGDQKYYDELQKFLDAQGVVLFEGVKPAAPVEAQGDDAARAKVTDSRQRLLAVLVARHRKERGEMPASLEAVLEPLHGTLARLGKAALVDGWGHPQKFVTATPGEKAPPYDIVSLGADGQEGGEGGAADINFRSQKPLTNNELNGAGEGIQIKLARALGLEFQLAAIDYNRAHWRNSDLAIDEVQKRLEETGAGGDALFSLLDGSSMASKFVGLLLGFIERDPQLSLMTKTMMVEVLANADVLMDANAKQSGGAAKLMKVIVEDRNEAVLRDLSGVLKEQPAPSSVALFYGAGHLPHLEQRLVADYGYRFKEDHWLRAIDVDLSASPQAKAQAKQMREMIRRMIEQQSKAAPDKPAQSKPE